MINESPAVGPVATNRSPSIGALAAALAKAQGAMEAAKKDSKNPHFKSSYADLASVWDACREPLSKNELAIVQFPEAKGKEVSVRTLLLHSSGEWLEGTSTATARGDGPQEVGSVITYLRRYSLMAVVGIAPEDDDGNAGQGHQGATNRPSAQPLPPAETPMITAKQLQQLAIECGRLFGDKPEDTERARKFIGEKVGRELASRKALTEAEATTLLKKFAATPAGKFFAAESLPT